MPAIISSRWYAYIGGNVTLPSSYLYTPATPTCTTGANLCAIYAVYAGSQPAGPFTTNLQNYISAALVTGVPQPSLPVGAVKYVVMKSNT